MLSAALLAGAERGLNRVLRLDPTALPRLARLSGRIIEIDCTVPAWRLFVLADGEGLRLAENWGSEPDCRLRTSAASLLRLVTSRNKTAILHGPDVEIEGDSALLMSFAGGKEPVCASRPSGRGKAPKVCARTSPTTSAKNPEHLSAWPRRKPVLPSSIASSSPSTDSKLESSSSPTL